MKTPNKFSLDEWTGCYPSNWKGVILPEAIAHPAKYSSRLIKKIYDHAIAEGWVTVGSKVIDPFGGIALGALDAVRQGMDWTGIELEPRFAELGGESYRCTGFTKDDWKRYYFRPGFIERLRTMRNLCPSCQAAMQPRKEYYKGTRILKVAVIPEREAHIFRGNIPLWDHRFSRSSRKWGTARLINGDSRKLLDLIHSQDLMTSSPPYNLPISQEHNGSRGGSRGTTPSETGAFVKYGNTPGQLEGLPMGDLDLALGSPPYADRNSAAGYQGRDAHLLTQNEGDTYGSTPGQLGAMDPTGMDLALSSPPYAETRNAPGGKNMDDLRRDYHGDGNYGETDGQLGTLDDKDFDLSLSSPPFLQASGGTPEPKPGGPIDEALYKRHAAGNAAAHGYGKTDGQLSSMGDDGFDISLSSPPYASTPVGSNNGRIDIEKQFESYKSSGGGQSFEAFCRTQELHSGNYGQSDGQLSAMPAGDFDASIGSPPFEDSLSRDFVNANMRREYARKNGISNAEHVSAIDMERVDARDQTYGTTPGQLGADSGDSFWLAARQIVDQVFAALKPGGHAVWVVKMYVKDRQLVDFPDQWRMLCEAAGFVTLHEHRALLVHHKGTSYTLEGGEVEHKTESKSFFRRTYEKKGGHRIDWETVYCMEKPGNE